MQFKVKMDRIYKNGRLKGMKFESKWIFNEATVAVEFMSEMSLKNETIGLYESSYKFENIRLEIE